MNKILLLVYCFVFVIHLAFTSSENGKLIGFITDKKIRQTN